MKKTAQARIDVIRARIGVTRARKPVPHFGAGWIPKSSRIEQKCSRAEKQASGEKIWNGQKNGLFELEVQPEVLGIVFFHSNMLC